ncbi:methylated-DNA--[protein]-cysteine S-methyltransferase [Paenibacillus lutrae]|uniref:methylated-DNA--[protein]-cysteine S-methyltransferase n=1 Tax=Paenibacillus lutrae TaxID=2078573 RepID=A0A7X3FLJ2_9BACL|nr:methylated-DNA--[protein]-cysteine S-methyltransferase [Paenibacillus lutrae]MVP01848.1 methylated-DNA--[protein]-cysteine S-methyltransferase [Paenibacillus lutrae]
MKTGTNEKIYWVRLIHADWNLYMAATQEGLCYIGSPDKPFEELTEWSALHYPGSELIQDEEKMKPYARELKEYLSGQRQDFTLPHDCKGTAFQQDVWKALCEIPYGHTMSYSDIANRINRPAAVRAVGTAIGANPVLISVPCHRVIGKNGSLTGYRGGLDMKMKLLQLESEQAVSERMLRNV